jgi:hypothetical protein
MQSEGRRLGRAALQPLEHGAADLQRRGPAADLVRAQDAPRRPPPHRGLANLEATRNHSCAAEGSLRLRLHWQAEQGDPRG